MQPYNRIYYSNVYWRLNMFRAVYPSSSGAVNCICSLWFTYTYGDRPLSSLSSINVGIINSVTRLHLVGYFYWFILRCTDPCILNFPWRSILRLWPWDLGYLTSCSMFHRKQNVDTEDGGSRYLRNFSTLCSTTRCCHVLYQNIFLKKLWVEDSCLQSAVALPVDMISPRCVLLIIKVLY